MKSFITSGPCQAIDLCKIKTSNHACETLENIDITNYKQVKNTCIVC